MKVTLDDIHFYLSLRRRKEYTLVNFELEQRHQRLRQRKWGIPFLLLARKVASMYK
jgi:hypothetical protein